MCNIYEVSLSSMMLQCGFIIFCSARLNCNATSIGHKTSASAVSIYATSDSIIMFLYTQALAGFNILVVIAGIVLTVVGRLRHASDNNELI